MQELKPSAQDLKDAIRAAVNNWSSIYSEARNHRHDAALLTGLVNDIAFELGITEALKDTDDARID